MKKTLTSARFPIQREVGKKSEKTEFFALCEDAYEEEERIWKCVSVLIGSQKIDGKWREKA